MADPINGTPFSLTEWIMGALWSILALLVGILAKRGSDDRQSYEKRLEMAASKEELRNSKIDISGFVSHREFELHRQEDRYDFGVIHAKIDAMNGDLHRKIDVLGANLNDSIRENQAEILGAIAQIKK
jgi:hypothetical protein